MSRRSVTALVVVFTAALLGLVAQVVRPAAKAAALPPMPLARVTTSEEMTRTLEIARLRLAADPTDVSAALALSDVLLRTGRLESHGAHAVEAEQVLERLLKEKPGEYDALKMLGAIYLSQHRFLDAKQTAGRALAIQPKDAWNYGVLGDALVELGEYGEAFDAFDTMAGLRPDAAAYARVAYAHELQGRRRDALRAMQRAAEATSAHDPEGQSWHYSQLGHLYLELGDVDAAAREYARAEFTFPGHPYAQAGLARVAIARGNHDEALTIYQRLMRNAATPELAAATGDLLAMRGDHDAAARMYARAESLERDGWATSAPQHAALARLLAERGLKTSEAVALAEQGAAVRRDIFTQDALAWAYYRAGRYDEAARASREARRTGSVDARLLYHAAAIEHARGNDTEARELLSKIAAEKSLLEPVIAPAVAELSLALDQSRIAAR
jgi:tetratricopeptide (TPR) repeat protein